MTTKTMIRKCQLELNRRALKQGNKNRTRWIGRAKRDGTFQMSHKDLKLVANFAN